MITYAAAAADHKFIYLFITPLGQHIMNTHIKETHIRNIHNKSIHNKKKPTNMRLTMP